MPLENVRAEGSKVILTVRGDESETGTTVLNYSIDIGKNGIENIDSVIFADPGEEKTVEIETGVKNRTSAEVCVQKSFGGECRTVRLEGGGEGRFKGVIGPKIDSVSTSPGVLQMTYYVRNDSPDSSVQPVSVTLEDANNGNVLAKENTTFFLGREEKETKETRFDLDIDRKLTVKACVERQ